MTLPLPARPDAAVVAPPPRPPGAPSVFACSPGGARAAIPASAVGLGPITQQSALGQSLRVVVPVTLGPGEELPSECFRIAAAERDADGIPQLLFGRVNVERSPSGTALVITNARPVSDPIVRLTIQAGCEAAMRREYTLFMDPPAIEAPVVAAEAAPREVVVAPPPAPVRARSPAPRARRRGARTSTRTAPAAGERRRRRAPTRKPAPPKGRAVAKAAPKRPPPRRRRAAAAFVVERRAGHRRRRGATGRTAKERSRSKRPRSKPRRRCCTSASWSSRRWSSACSRNCGRRSSAEQRRPPTRRQGGTAGACGGRAGRTGEGRIRQRGARRRRPRPPPIGGTTMRR